MQEKKLILIVLLACIIGRMLITPLPINEDITTGADQAVYLMRGEILKENGWINWNPYWYGGYPFLKFYPPLSFYMLAILTNFLSIILIYKLLTLIFFVIGVLAFYWFLKEFKFSVKEMLIATVIFSFTMYYNAFIFFGQFPSIIAIPLALVFLKFFVKAVRHGKGIYIALSSLFLTASILTQQIVSFMAFLTSIIFLASSLYVKFDKQALKRSLFVWIPAILASSFWLLPTLLEAQYSYTGIGILGVLNMFLLSIPIIGIAVLFGGIYINLYTVLLGLLASLLALLGMFKFFERGWKKEPENVFWISSTIIFIVSYFALYALVPNIIPFPPQRFVILWSIPLAVLIAKASNFKNADTLVYIFIIMQLILFFGMPMIIQTKEQYTKFDPAFQYLEGRGGRFSFQPQYAPYNKATVTDFRPILYHLENELGIFGQGLPENRIKFIYYNFAFNCQKTMSAFERAVSTDFLNRYYIPSKDCELINENLEEYFYLQNVRYVIVDKKFPNVVNYFKNKSTEYKEILTSNDFIVYKFLRNPPYIETKPKVDYNYTKNFGRINITLSSVTPIENISVRVSESWYPHWGSDEVEVKSDSSGFITFTVDKIEGKKTISLEYKEPDYYDYLGYVSIFGIILIGLFGFDLNKFLKSKIVIL